MRKTARWLLFGGIGFFVFLAAGGQVFLRSPAAARWTVRWAADRLAASLPGASIAISAVDGDFVSGIMVRGLELRAAGRPILAAERVFCSFDPLGLVVGFVHLPVLEVVGVEAAGPLPGWPAVSSPEFRVPLPLLGRIDRFVVRECRLRPGAAAGKVVEVDAEGNGGFSLFSLRGWQSWWTVDDGSARFQDRAVAFRLQHLRLAAGRPLQWLGLRVQSGASVVRLDGRLDGSRRLRVSWETPGLRPADFAGDLTLRVAGKGTLSSLPDASLQSASPGRRLSWSRLAVRFAGSVDGRRLQASGVVSGLPASPSWEGSLSVQGWSGADLQRLLAAGGKGSGAWPEMAGITARLYLHYRAGRPVQGEVTVQGMRVAGMAVQGRGRFSWHGQRLVLRDMECSVPAGRLWDGEATFRSPAAWTLSARLAGETREMALLAGLASLPANTLPSRLSGRVRLAATGKGIEGRVVFAPVAAGPLGRAGATFTFRLQDDGLWIDRGRIDSDVGALVVRGRLADGAARLQVSASLPDVGKVLSGLEGEAEVSGTVEGDARHPRLAATFRAARVTGAAAAAEEVEGSLVMTDLFQPRSAALILAAGRLRLADAVVTGVRLAGHPVAGGWRLTRLAGTAFGREWNLQDPVRVVRAGDEGGAGWRLAALSLLATDGTRVAIRDGRLAEGGLDAEVVVEGGALVPIPMVTAVHTRLRASVRFPSLSVGRFALEVGGRYQDRSFRIQGTGRRAAAGPLEATVGVDLDRRRVARFSGRIPLAALWQKGGWQQVSGEFGLQGLPLDLLPSSWLAGRCAGGVVTATLRADGRGSVAGEVDVSDSQCRVDVLGLAFTGLSARIAATAGGRGVRIEEGRLRTAAGEIGVTGAVSLPCRLDLSLSADDVGFVFHSLYQGRAGFALTMKGRCAGPEISGTIWPASRVVRRLGGETEPAGGDVAVFDRRPLEGASRPAAADRLPVSLDCRIELPDAGLRFEAEGISLDLSGWFRARIAAGGSRYDGRLQILGGEYVAYRRQCAVTGGELRFAGKPSFDPDLSARAECRLPGVTITAYAGGTIHEPDIILESDPWMSEEEIKAALIFGKPFAALSGSQREAYQAAALASLLGSSVLDRFADMAGYETLVDSFSFYTRGGGESGQGVAVDTFLTRNLRLGYAYEFGEQPGGKIRVEYLLQGGLSVESLYSEQGEDTGFDLIWRRDF